MGNKNDFATSRVIDVHKTNRNDDRSRPITNVCTIKREIKTGFGRETILTVVTCGASTDFIRFHWFGPSKRVSRPANKPRGWREALDATVSRVKDHQSRIVTMGSVENCANYYSNVCRQSKIGFQNAGGITRRHRFVCPDSV